MFNPNDIRSIWPSITPLNSQQSNQMQFSLYNNNNNNQTLNQSNFSQQIPMNTSFLLQNQQNMNQMMAYYNQNQGFAQQLSPFINDYNCFRPSLQQQLTQTNSPSFVTQSISQPNIGLSANPLLQTYSPITQKPIQTLVSPQMQTNSYQNINNTNIDSKNSNNWLNLLNPTQKSVLEVLDKEQEEFELQFKNWEKDFEIWKESNRLHPDKNAYYSYVIQWQEWRKKLVSRQQQMKELRNKTMDQLYSQVSQSHQISHQNVIPHQSEQETQQLVHPPLPSVPQTVRSAPPPPPPSIPSESDSSSTPVKTFSSNVFSHKNIEKDESFNEDKDSDIEVIETINRQDSITSNAIDNKDSNESNFHSSKFKKDNSFVNKITVESNPVNNSVCAPKSESENANNLMSDSNVVSKAAETILFIQKQQELLKTLDSFKKANELSGELEIIDGPKPFDINEIVTKMKAIRPPENPIETNQILSHLPSLQGILYNQNSQNSYDGNRQQFPNPSNQSFERPQEQHQRYQNNYTNAIQLPDYRDNRFLNDRNFDLFQRPQTHNSNNRQFLPFNSVESKQWMDSRPNISREREYFHEVNDTKSHDSFKTDNVLPLTQSSNMLRKYSAQTIDYNHRPENRNYNTRDEPQYSIPYVEQLSHSYPNQNFDNKMYNNFNIQSSNSSLNNNNNSNNNNIFNTRKPLNSPENKNVEEKPTYGDSRFFTEPNNRIVLFDDLLKPPSRELRPKHIVVILRGLPGSGKTRIAKMIKEKEVDFGGSAPRILSIDDYFMTEVEKNSKDPETGKISSIKEYVYEYESEMESCYRTSLLKTFKKTIDDRLYPFIIIDAVNEMIGYIEEFYSYAIKNGFVVYVCEMECNDPSVCHKNSVHKRILEDIKSIHKKWENLPDFMLRLDIRGLFQNKSIEEVKIDSNNSKASETLKRKAESESENTKKLAVSLDSIKDNDSSNTHSLLSRWERMESSDEKLDKLDSFKMKTKLTIEEYLQVTDDYEQRQGQKRVRWADIEEGKKQDQMRKIGFVVGVDWQQFMDPQHCERALTKTKYF